MKRAVVVGGHSAIGIAVAKRLASLGYDVSGIVRREDAPLREVYTHLRLADLSEPDRLEAALLSEPWDLLVYAAGEPAMGRTLDVPTEDARRSFEVNFWGLERSVRAVLPSMMARGGGAIVAILSIAAVRAIPYEAYYASAKAAAARYLECLAHEAEPNGVRIRYVAPGFIDTGFIAKRPWFGMKAPSVSGSGVTPDDVALAAIAQLERARVSSVLGHKERAIQLADRLAPGLYDRFLRFRHRRAT